MDEIKQLELLSDSIRSEIDELQSLLENSDNVLLKAKKLSFQKQLKNIISNLEGYNDSVYVVYEDLNSKNNEELKGNYEILQDILQEKLSYEEKIDMRIKYNIDIY